MRVRVKIGWQTYEPGQVYEDWHDGAAEILIARGILEKLEDEPSVSRSEQKRRDRQRERDIVHS